VLLQVPVRADNAETFDAATVTLKAPTTSHGV
jgi:hypothetical protein